VAVAMNRLSSQARLAVAVHRFDGYALHEIAERLGSSIPLQHMIEHSSEDWRAIMELWQSAGVRLDLEIDT
jgi:hypothetical protein